MANDDIVIAGRYRLDKVLGRGGMSEVWRAKDLELGRMVALKLLGPDADRARFEREARAVASLAHPNITQVYDFGEWEGRPYMVLEYLSGGTLEDRLANGKPLPDDEAFAIAAAVASGLAHAHARGVVHRDLKPANVLFDSEGRPKVADFGIARMSGGGTLTDAGTVLGTAAYISPEQALGEPATAASDVYSFGVLLYRMLTGRLPFESANALELVTLHRDAPPPPIEAFRRDAPALLESTAVASLAKDPHERPPDGAALLRRLGVPTGSGLTTTAAFGDAVTRVMPVAAPAATAAAPADAFPAPPPRRSRTALVVAALVLLALAGAVIAYAVTRDSSPSPGTGTTLPPPTREHHTTTGGTTTTAPQTTTEQTTSAATTTQAATTRPATTQPATTAPPPPTTTAPPPTTTEPPPTTTALPPTTTAAPPPTSATDTTTLPAP